MALLKDRDALAESGSTRLLVGKRLGGYGMNIHFLGVFESIWLNLNGFEDNTLLIKRSGSVDRRPLSDPMVEVRGLRVNYG